MREWDIHALKGWRFDAWVPWLHIKVSFGQILNPKLLPIAITSVWLCECTMEIRWDAMGRKSCIAADERVRTLHGSLRHQCINVWMNGWMLQVVDQKGINASLFTKLVRFWTLNDTGTCWDCCEIMCKELANLNLTIYSNNNSITSTYVVKQEQCKVMLWGYFSRVKQSFF